MVDVDEIHIIQEQLLAVAEKVIALRNQRDELDRKISAAMSEQIETIRAASATLGSSAKATIASAASVAPHYAQLSATITGAVQEGSLRKRILRWLHEANRAATTAEISAAMGLPTKTVRMCLQDLRSKQNFVTKPGTGLWEINDDGRKASV